MKNENANKIVCLFPNCKHDAVTRGLCAACYGAANKLVKAGQLTWEYLVNAGKATPASRLTGKMAFFLEGIKKD